MNYKFYIYKQSVLVNFDKYDLSQYVLLREIQQNSKWGLKIERDREWFTVIRRTFSGNITVKGADFDALIATEGDVKQYAIVIHRECSGVYTEFWKGYFSYFDFKTDLDTCYLTFEPKVWDKYTPIYDQLDIERNVLASDTGQTVMMDGFTWPTEEYVYSSVENHLPVYTLPFSTMYVECPYLPAGNQYYFYSFTARIIHVYPMYWDWSWTYIYKREYAFSLSNAILPPGTNWVLDPQLPGPGEYSPGVWKWVRPIGNLALPAGQPINYAMGPYTNPTTLTLLLPSTSSYVLQGCITLKSVLEYFASIFSLTYESDFFNDSPCPMGGSTLLYTLIQQISNIRDTTDPASKGMMKLKDLLSWIRDTFNVYWYVDAAGDWRFEHRKYFDTGLSYTVPAAIEVDISALYPVQIKHLNKYEWNKPELFRYEKLDIPFSYFFDWTDAWIEYTQLSILGNETKTYSVEWGTDAVGMFEDSENLPKNGWLLLNCWQDILIKKVTNTIGAITGSPFQNARFSQANLMRDLWGWGRILPTGNVNGEPTTFDSIERLRKQVTLSIPQCCEDLDYNGLFRTELGDGLIDSAEYEQNGTLKLNLIYE